MPRRFRCLTQTRMIFLACPKLEKKMFQILRWTSESSNFTFANARVANWNCKLKRGDFNQHEESVCSCRCFTSLVSTQSVSQVDTQKQAQEEATCIHGAVCGHK
jgi:hypothetical protein